MSTNFNQVKKAYFLGIGGIGVSAIARMFLHEGKEVLGSDTAHTEITEELEVVGAKIFIGQDVENIPADTDLVIYSIALDKFAPEFMKEVRGKIKNVISYPEGLAVLSKDKFTIAIAGTHGKTTTTAMIAKIMIDAGLDPTVIVGSKILGVNSNFVAGKSKYLVVEACEYCRSFLNINPTVAAVTNIDADHLDYYKDIEDIKVAFKEFLEKVPNDGAMVGNLEDKKIREVSEVCKGKIINSNNFFDENLVVGVPGEHNRRNASVALAVADFLGVDKNSALKSLSDFGGTWRRFEYKGETEKGALVYDDYAHHPTEIEVTLKGAREKFPDKKIAIVFQPHLFSRTKSLFSGFVESLSKADSVILLPIYKAREKDDSSISSEMLVEEIKRKSSNVYFASNFSEAKENLSTFDSSFLILIMGAGDIAELLKEIIYAK